MTIYETAIVTKNRTEFQKLMSYLARAVDTTFLHNSDRIPVILITGDAGKSLAAETMMKTWMDGHSLRDAVTIPKDDKMFLESSPARAIKTVSTKAPVAGKVAKLAFNSRVIGKLEILDRLFNKEFAKASTGGAMIFSNPSAMFAKNFFNNYSNEKGPVLMSLNIGMMNAVGTPDNFGRTIEIRIHDQQLWNTPRFQTYWNSIDMFRRSGGLSGIHEPASPLGL